jgi:hypothetical protein
VSLEPGHGSGPGGKGQGHMRASRVDRDRVVDVLKSAFAEERLAKDELDDRLGRALAARTWEDLDALVADIPAGPRPARPPVPAAPSQAERVTVRPSSVHPRPDRPHRGRRASRSMRALVALMAVVILLAGSTAGAVAGPGPGVVIAGLASGVVFIVLWVVACCSIVRERPRR